MCPFHRDISFCAHLTNSSKFVCFLNFWPDATSCTFSILFLITTLCLCANSLVLVKQSPTKNFCREYSSCAIFPLNKNSNLHISTLFSKLSIFFFLNMALILLHCSPYSLSVLCTVEFLLVPPVVFVWLLKKLQSFSLLGNQTNTTGRLHQRTFYTMPASSQPLWLQLGAWGHAAVWRLRLQWEAACSATIVHVTCCWQWAASLQIGAVLHQALARTNSHQHFRAAVTGDILLSADPSSPPLSVVHLVCTMRI